MAVRRRGWAVVAAVLAAPLLFGWLYLGVAGRHLIVVEVHGDALADYSVDRNLVDEAEDAFVGTVVERTGTTNDSGFPETQSSVRIERLLKGSASGLVTVNQQGGRTSMGAVLELNEGDPLLVPGERYFFFTNRYPRPNGEVWHTIVWPGFANIQIESTDHEERLWRRFERAL